MNATAFAQAHHATLESAQSTVEGMIGELRGVSGGQSLQLIAEAYAAQLYAVGQAIDSAAGIAAISGSPAQIQTIAGQYRKAAGQAADAAASVQTAAGQTLPVAWKGPAWESARVVFQAVQVELTGLDTGLSDAAGALTAYGQALGTSISTDAQGHSQLASGRTGYHAVMAAFTTATVGQLTGALNQAANGLGKRVSAWQTLSTASTRFIELLNQYAATDARAGRLDGSTEDPLTALVIATSQDPDAQSAGVGVDIDDANSLSLGAQRLAAMNAADQARFQSLLASCGSPQEAAYLWKAVAAGYPMSTVKAFDQAIGAHGADPDWLAQHLDVSLGAPEVPGQQSGVGYPGASTDTPYSQGSVNDCVAASTVMAAVNNDPVLSLFLTTGFSGSSFSFLTDPKSTWVGGRFGHMQTTDFPYKAGDDSPAAVEARTQALFQNRYQWGLSHDGIDSLDQIWPGAGIGEWGQHNLANNLLGTMNGANYTFVKMNNATDRASALQQIDASVSAGVPVTFTVRAEGISNTFNRHQMAIIGSDASTGMLEVYNPWGYTQWISAQDFVNGNVGSLTGGSDGNMKLPYNIEIPTPTSP